MYVKDHFWDRQRLRKIVSAESAEILRSSRSFELQDPVRF